MFSAINLRKGRVSIPGRYYAITITTQDRRAIFTQLPVNQLLGQEIYKLEDKQYADVIAYTIMPDHIHLLIKLGSTLELGQVIKFFKGRTATLLRNTVTGKVWQKGYYDTCIRREEELLNQARYIVANPLRKGLCERVSEYSYWDCVYLNDAK